MFPPCLEPGMFAENLGSFKKSPALWRFLITADPWGGTNQLKKGQSKLMMETKLHGITTMQSHNANETNQVDELEHVDLRFNMLSVITLLPLEAWNRKLIGLERIFWGGVPLDAFGTVAP